MTDKHKISANQLFVMKLSMTRPEKVVGVNINSARVLQAKGYGNLDRPGDEFYFTLNFRGLQKLDSLKGNHATT